MDSSYLFVYGTLRRGFPNRFARFLAMHSRFLGNARMPARLDRIGKYISASPTAAAGHWVRGELFRLAAPTKIWPILDAYEAPEYVRAIASVRTESGRCMRAWVYSYRS